MSKVLKNLLAELRVALIDWEKARTHKEWLAARKRVYKLEVQIAERTQKERRKND